MHRSSSQSGFGLVELLFALAIFAMVFLAITGIFRTNNSALIRGQAKIEAQQNARVAVELFSRELRLAGYDPAGAIAAQTSATAFQSGGTGSIVFLADVDSDDVVERVTFRAQGHALMRDVEAWNGAGFEPAISSIMAEGINELLFNYFDATDGVITAPVATTELDRVRRVQVRLSTAHVSKEGWKVTYPLVADIRLRNRP